MAEKKIIIDINDTGNINAETFGIHGAECIQELDKMLKDLALETVTNKKTEFFKEGKIVDKTIKAEKI